LGLWILTLTLFLNAIYQGGGEPLGLSDLKEIGKPTAESPIVKYYSESTKYYTTGPESDAVAEKAKPEKTWFWWEAWFVSLLVAILFIPLAFWDEIVAGWHRTRDIVEQRPARIRLAPETVHHQPQQGAEGQPAQARPPAAHRSFWTRFRERFAASLSADMLTEFLFDTVGRIFRQRITRR